MWGKLVVLSPYLLQQGMLRGIFNENNLSPDEIMDWWNIESGNEGGEIVGIVGNGGNDGGDVLSLVHAGVWTSKATESKDVEGLLVVILIISGQPEN